MNRPVPAPSPSAGVRNRHAILRSNGAGILCSIALALLLVTGCNSPQDNSTDFDPRPFPADSATGLVSLSLTDGIAPEWLRPPSEPYRLGPGDRIDIEILGEEEGTWSTFVGPDGKIYLHLLPGLQVWGLTLEETKALIEKEVEVYIHSPQVAITLVRVQSKRVWVLGRVTTPGIYSLQAPMTIIEAITKAGGLFTSRFAGTTEELADLHHSFLIRQGQAMPVNFHELLREGDTSQNIYLQPDDFIYLPSSLSSEVYVLGAVYQPRAVGFKDQVTLVSAIAKARGTIKDARLGNVAIVRGSLTTPQIAIINYDAILKGEAKDVRLQPRDIVYVPFTPYRSLNNYANLIVNTFVRTVAANEGGRAVNPDYSAPGVSIPINQ